MLARLHGGLRGRVGYVGQRAAAELLGNFRQGRVRRIRIVPGKIEDGVRELAAFLLIKLANLQENAGQDLLVQLRVSGRGHGGPLPLQPAGRVHERAVFLRESRPRQTIYLSRNVLHIRGGNARRFPKLAGLVGINVAHREPVGLLQGLDHLLRIRPDGDRVHAERHHAFHLALVHVVPDMRPRVFAVHFGQVGKRPIVLLGSGVAVHGLEQGHREPGRIAPIVERVPLFRLGRLGSDASHPARKVRVRGIGDFQVPWQVVEDSRDIGGALDIRVAAQCVHAAAGAPHVAENQLQHRCRPDDLRSERVVRPSHRVYDCAGLLGAAVFADGGEQVGGFQELVLGDAGDALDHFWRVARILLLQKLIHAAGMFESGVVRHVRRERRLGGGIRMAR